MLELDSMSDEKKREVSFSRLLNIARWKMEEAVSSEVNKPARHIHSNELMMMQICIAIEHLRVLMDVASRKEICDYPTLFSFAEDILKGHTIENEGTFDERIAKYLDMIDDVKARLDKKKEDESFDGWFYTVEPEWRDANKQEFDELIKNYPRRLMSDGFMDRRTYFDFSVAPMWPYGLMVAQSDVPGSYFRICTNIDAVVASKIPGHWAKFDAAKRKWVKTIEKMKD